MDVIQCLKCKRIGLDGLVESSAQLPWAQHPCPSCGTVYARFWDAVLKGWWDEKRT